ncbi:conserved hypothetical protein [Talaromyces stipitatus ATCC 10500]|uniref:Amidoligase enzyme n=1 Tax=Talaromyces stipitatus (strain ATCC 10500 / CBS 375.48 / QM 6759 / NRRL 1006) TaxID=441959 RepID=B8MAA7_TALSN|nr:uncharacterized protein TSTA_123420 [Talaromyces stipitatus ATCC 10500]EED18609.1 conserved hypothetical protein [Talaromyces stipitatus ATCC 10500]
MAQKAGGNKEPQVENTLDGYKFGIELEYRLTPRGNKQKPISGPEVCDELAKLWNETHGKVKGVNPMESRYLLPKTEEKGSRDYKRWNIVNEASMKPGENDSIPLEIVSPAFEYSKYGDWKDEIERVLDHILNETVPEMDNSTGFHIHVAPDDRPWTPLELKRIAAAIVHFDRPLRDLFPRHEFTEEWNKSNVSDNGYLGDPPGRKTALKIISDAKTKYELINAMNFDWEEKKRRNYAWNFTNNSEVKSQPRSARNTMEFRLPKSTTEVEVIEKWITFTVTFLHASLFHSEVYIDFKPTLGGLNGFLVHNCPPSTEEFCWKKHLAENWTK